ncbi:MAG: glycosyltransferase family 39 protein [Chloroflexi bacterium]|nr:glycosyltransferase family 39 protein [Chloroflexota bacterium]
MTNIQNTSTLIAVPHSAPTVVAPARRATMLWHYLALVGVMCIALFFHVYQLDREGYGNMYYAAAVKSMSLDLKSFFFNSFDTASFVTVDKPPLGLWMQVFSVWLFGYSGISLMLPQVIAGVLSVALLYVLVRRVFGEWAGLIAALVLAVTPISIAANRNNTMDSQLVFTSLLAAWAISLAADALRVFRRRGLQHKNAASLHGAARILCRLFFNRGNAMVETHRAFNHRHCFVDCRFVCLGRHR